jgi:hypothetical protein
MLPAIRPRFRLLAIVACLALVPSAAIAAGSSPHQAAKGHKIANGNTCHRNAIDVPSCGVLWGLFKPRVAVAGKTYFSAHYQAVEKTIGRRFDLVKNYVDWGAGDTFPAIPDRRLAHDGRTLYFSWNPINYKTHQDVSYTSIANGAWDSSVIRPEAEVLKRFHHRVFLDFGHEFDADSHTSLGTPAEFAAAYRHIEDVMRRAGVHNVIWSWVSTGSIGNKQAILAGYPGARYVDWVGYDPYNFANCTGRDWHSTYATFHPFYRWTSHQPGMSHKPLLASEYGSAPGSRVKKWYDGIPSMLHRMPRLRAMMQFSGPTTTPCAVQLNASSDALAGFVHASRSRQVLGR